MACFPWVWALLEAACQLWEEPLAAERRVGVLAKALPLCRFKMETALPPRMTFSVFPSSHPPSAFLSPSRAFFSSSDSVANCAAVQEGALVYLLRRKSVLFIVHRCEVPVKVRGARGRPGSDFSSVSVHLHTCPPSRRVYCCCPMLSDVFFFFKLLLFL